MGSTGAPEDGAADFGPVEKESRCMRACREARRLISRRPTRSPRLKLPLPCLNSHRGESGEPVWKTSLTGIVSAGKRQSRGVAPTFVESVHIQLSHKR